MAYLIECDRCKAIGKIESIDGLGQVPNGWARLEIYTQFRFNNKPGAHPDFWMLCQDCVENIKSKLVTTEVGVQS